LPLTTADLRKWRRNGFGNGERRGPGS